MLSRFGQRSNLNMYSERARMIKQQTFKNLAKSVREYAHNHTDHSALIFHSLICTWTFSIQYPSILVELIIVTPIEIHSS